MQISLDGKHRTSASSKYKRKGEREENNAKLLFLIEPSLIRQSTAPTMSVTAKYPTLDPELAPFIAAMMQGPVILSGVQEDRAMVETATARTKETLKDSFPPGTLSAIPSITFCSDVETDLGVC